MQVFCFTFLAKALVAGGMQLKHSIGSVDIIYGMSLVGDILLQNQLFICSDLLSMITVCNVHTLGNYSGSIYPKKLSSKGLVYVESLTLLGVANCGMIYISVISK